LRAVRHNWKPPGEYVLLECELPDAAVMLSDFDAWHIILNNQYVSISDEDEAAYLMEAITVLCIPQPWTVTS